MTTQTSAESNRRAKATVDTIDATLTLRSFAHTERFDRVVMDHDPDWYRDSENWAPPYVEVAIDLGSIDDVRLCAAFSAAWSAPILTGPLEPRFPGEPPGLPEAPLDRDRSIHTYGTIQLSSAARSVGCDILAVSDPDSDWLDIAIPSGMLELVFGLARPLMSDASPRPPGVDRDLVSIADRVYGKVPFDLATVGEEVSGMFFADEARDERAITREVVERAGGFLLSERLWARLRPAVEPEVLPSGLLWVTPTGRGYWA